MIGLALFTAAVAETFVFITRAFDRVDQRRH
jgi:hypothetical protein